MFKKQKSNSELSQLNRTVGGMVVGGIGMGVGSQLVGSIGGSSAPHVQKAIGNVAKAYPTIGTISGAGAVMGTLKKLKNKLW